MTRTVRPARPADGPALRAIQRVALVQPAEELLSLGLAGGARCLVLEPGDGDGGPVGYVLALDADEHCYIAELAVAPDHRRQGYGSALLAALVSRTTGGELRLTVRADDADARAFYAACGFRVVERRPGRFDGADGLVMAREER